MLISTAFVVSFVGCLGVNGVLASSASVLTSRTAATSPFYSLELSVCSTHPNLMIRLYKPQK